MKKVLLGAAAVFALAGGFALAQTLSIPQVQSIGSTDLFQDVVGGVPQAQSSYATAPMLGNYSQTQPDNNPANALIGGDASTNLFQRGTTGSSVTTTVTYGGPDRWAYWSGTGTAMTVSRDSTAGDLPSGYQYAFKMARTSGQTGVVQVCMMQEVASANSYGFAGQTAELDFHAVTGANFSAALGQMKAYILTGTGTDDGVAGTASGAFGLNAGGGGSGGWAGQVNWAGTITLGVSSSGRYSIAAPVPAGTTEIGVALCYTPVGTAGTNDYIAFSGIQLVRNSALNSLVAGNASGTATVLNVNDARAKSFLRRSADDETRRQLAYYYQLNDPAATVHIAPCQVITANTAAVCSVPLPVPMRAAPTITAPGSHTAFAITAADGTANVCTALAVTASSTVLATGGQIQVTCTPTSNIAVTVPSWLIGDATIYNIQASAEL